MLESKTRAALRSLAAAAPSILQIGKNGVEDNVVKQLEDALNARELVKVTILKACEEDHKALFADLAKLLGAEQVTLIGNKMVFYRLSLKKGVKHIL
ncbi:MAG: YhbY family RNA-binding protein [Clostridiales bacterium]|jgi:RNA-binding protein|nr:YhbY family RNA-binding protein [Clostridiales bacterium]